MRLEISIGLLGILNNVLAILDALLNIGESFSIECSPEEALRDLHKRLNILLFLLSALDSTEGKCQLECALH